MTKLCRPDAFEKLVGVWGTGPRVPVTIMGPVDFSGAQFARPLQFNGVRFSGPVSAVYAKFEAGLTFRGCEFDRGLDLTGAKIGGSLIFETCKFGLPRRAAGGRTELSLRLDHATVDGDVKIATSTVQGYCSAAGVDVGGDLRFAAVQIGMSADANQPAVDLNHARIGGSLSLDHPETRSVLPSFGEAASRAAPSAPARSQYHRTVSAQSVTVGGDLSCGAAIVDDDLWLSGATARNFDLTGARIKGDLVAVGATCGSIFRLRDRCSIGRNLDLSLATIRGQLDLEDIEAVQMIRFNGTACGSFLVASKLGTSVACYSIDAVDSTFSSYVKLHRLSVTRKPVSEPVTTIEQMTAGISFQSCTFGNGLALWRPDVSDANDQTKTRVIAFSDVDLECRTSIKGNLKIVDCQITGDLDLTGVRMEDSEATDQRSDDGQISLDRTTVTGALRFCSPESFANRGDIVTIARNNAIKVANGEQRGCWQAKARKLRIAGVTATDVDLTGLCLGGDAAAPPTVASGSLVDRLGSLWRRLLGVDRPAPAKPPRTTDLGCVDAARVSVAGTFKIYDEVDKTTKDSIPLPTDARTGALNNAKIDKLSAHAVVPGSLDLEHCTIGELVLSKHSFGKNKSLDPRTDGIVLTDASIGRLRIPQILQDKNDGDAHKDNGFPVPLDLEGAKITSWSFDMGSDGKDEVAGQENADRYLDVLDNDVILHRSIYRAVYAQLRNAGQDDAANRVFFAEAYRAFWSTRGKWKRGHKRMGHGGGLIVRGLQVLWDWVSRKFLRYGTSPVGLSKVIVGLFLVSLVLVAREPRNFEIDDSVREVLAAGDPVDRGYATCDDGTVLGPDPSKWGWMDALWLTARYHVPVIGLTARSEFKPTNDRRIIWNSKCPTWDDPLPIHWRSAYTACPPIRADAPVVGHRLPILADGWFNLMLVLNWVLWPILLTFLLRKVLRNE